MASFIVDKVKIEQFKNSFKQNHLKSNQQNQLIKYVPNKSEKSEILNDYQISALIGEFPSMTKMSNWELIYSLNRDGVSMITFFEKCKRYRTTLLVVQDL